MRDTRQRQAILDVLRSSDRPLTTQEIAQAARLHVRRLGLATVYRTVRSLLQEKALKSVEIANQPCRYERSDLAHHHHFRCRHCEKLFDVEKCGLNVSNLVPRGFFLEDHEVLLFGLCRDCNR